MLNNKSVPHVDLPAERLRHLQGYHLRSWHGPMLGVMALFSVFVIWAMNFHIDEKGVAAAGRINGVPVRAVAPLNLAGTNAKAGLVISKDDKGKFQQSIDFGAGFSSLSITASHGPR